MAENVLGQMDVTSARYTRLQGDAGGVDAGSSEGAGPRSAGGWAGAGEGSLQPPKGRRTPSVNAPLPPLPPARKPPAGLADRARLLARGAPGEQERRRDSDHVCMFHQSSQPSGPRAHGQGIPRSGGLMRIWLTVPSRADPVRAYGPS